MNTTSQYKPLSNTELSAFCSQMAMLLKAGISSMEGISMMQEDASSTEEKALLTCIYETLLNTGSFHEALASTKIFPDYMLRMTQIGEMSGRLDDVMEKLSHYYEREESINQSIRHAVTYPFIMIGMMILIVVVLLVKVLPIFNQVFEQMGQQMEGVSRVLLNLGNVIGNYSYLFIGIFALCILLFLYSTQSKNGRAKLYQTACHIPFTASLCEQIALSRFTQAMALTLKSGLTTEESLQTACELINHAGIQKKLEECKNLMEQGEELSVCLTKSNILNGIYGRMVAIGSRSGSLEEVLEKIADQYQEEADQKISRAISLLEPTLVALLSVVVGMILLSVMLPLMGLMSGM